MFSRKERDYLTLLANHREPGTDLRKELAVVFPNPTYQRKLQWAIRKKTTEVLSDLDLYARAAKVESRVLPAILPPIGESPPLAADPLVVLLRSIQGRLASVGHRSPTDPDASRPTTKKEEGE